MKKLLLTLALAAAPLPACAQTALPDADPALWVVKDADTTVYLFGTFHMLDGKRDWFNDEVKAAYDKSQEVMLEARLPDDPAAMQPLIMKYGLDMSGKKLSDKLPADMKPKYEKAVAAAGVPAMAFEPMEPWFATLSLSAIATQKLGLKPEHGPETIITAAAKKDGKPIGELEGFEFQFNLFDKMPEAEQITYLGQTLDQLEDMGSKMTPMVDAWANGNTDSLVKIMNKSIGDNPKLYKAIFSDRNAAWADWVQKRMEKPGTVFIAVGAGHLAGKNSVQDFLSRKGIKSQRVKQ